MNQPAASSSIRARSSAFVVAVLLTGSQLLLVEQLAQYRSVSAHAQIVQLERVVVTGHRLAHAPAEQLVAKACTAWAQGGC